jgi:hypothetical protein
MNRFAFLPFRVLRRILPNQRIFNTALMAYPYRLAHGRWPRPAAAANATINDFIFHRLASRRWTVLEQACSDKIFAKIFACGLAPIAAARTVAILSVRPETTLADVQLFLAPYAGQRLVLKPAHSCGQVVFLPDHSPRQLISLLRLAKRNYATLYREQQYAQLETRLVLETYIDMLDGISDLKFFCAAGQALLCQIDYGRFTGHRRAFISLPDLTVLDLKWKNIDLPTRVSPPENLLQIAALAATLAKPFEFVRIDLYNTVAGIFFGEFTFTPGAGMSKLSSEVFGIALLRRIRAAIANQSA